MNELTQGEKEFLIELIQDVLDNITLMNPAANVSRMLALIEKLKTNKMTQEERKNWLLDNCNLSAVAEGLGLTIESTIDFICDDDATFYNFYDVLEKKD
jgi:hypothetical protein